MLNSIPSPVLRSLVAAIAVTAFVAALFGCYWLGYEHGLRDSRYGSRYLPFFEYPALEMRIFH